MTHNNPTPISPLMKVTAAQVAWENWMDAIDASIDAWLRTEDRATDAIDAADRAEEAYNAAWAEFVKEAYYELNGE